jgi:hypothetical protein
MLDVFEIRPKVASKSSSSYYNNLVQRKQNILMLEFVPAEGRQFTCSTSHLLFHLNRRLTSLTTFFLVVHKPLVRFIFIRIEKRKGNKCVYLSNYSLELLSPLYCSRQ